jgi:hypothetical protein
LNFTPSRRFAFFITPHGYGHASRAAAVMLALRSASPGTSFEIFTQVPRWLFDVTLVQGFHYHDLLSDIGLVQDSVMDENLPETVQKLSNMLPFQPERIDRLAEQVKAAGCDMVICDVSAMGIAVARAAGLPSVLVENFTWDWIYEGYLEREPRLSPYIDYLRGAYASVDTHIRTQPACSDHLEADLITSVVGRKARTPAEETRASLGLEPDKPMILITMGGIGSSYPFLDQIASYPGANFLIPGGSDHFEKHGSLILLAHHSNFYHPDLVEASDAVIGKLGYSTLAETYLAGIPFTYIPRPRFRESEVMSRFVVEHMHGIELTEERFFSGDWLQEVPRLLEIPRQRPTTPDGGDQIAEFLLSRQREK